MNRDDLHSLIVHSKKWYACICCAYIQYEYGKLYDGMYCYASI
jgi:hypothetical protein